MSKRYTVGTIYKGKKQEDGSLSPDYLTINLNHDKVRSAFMSALEDGNKVNLQLENRQTQLDNINFAEKNGKISEDNAAKARARAEDMPDFVRFEVVLKVKD